MESRSTTCNAVALGLCFSNFYEGVLLLRVEASDCSHSRPRGIPLRVHVSCVLSLTSLLLWTPPCISGMNHGHCNLHSAHESPHGPDVVTLPGRFPMMRGYRHAEHAACRTQLYAVPRVTVTYFLRFGRNFAEPRTKEAQWRAFHQDF